MGKRKPFLLISIITILCIYSPCYAAGLFAEEDFEDVILGIGARYSASVYVDVGENFQAVPIIFGKYKRFYAEGTYFGYILNDHEELALSLVAQPRFMGYDSNDSPDLGGMQDRDGSLDAGLNLAWDNDCFSLNLTAVTDLLSEHEGQEIKLLFSREFLDGFFTPRIGCKWQSEDLVDYYYGVEATEARAGRAAYSADSAVNFVAGIRLAVSLDENWAIVTDFEYEALNSEIEDSPIVDAEEILTYIAGLVYRF